MITAADYSTWTFAQRATPAGRAAARQLAASSDWTIRRELEDFARAEQAKLEGELILEVEHALATPERPRDNFGLPIELTHLETSVALRYLGPWLRGTVTIDQIAAAIQAV